jgi:hypothetical protein
MSSPTQKAEYGHHGISEATPYNRKAKSGTDSRTVRQKGRKLAGGMRFAIAPASCREGAHLVDVLSPAGSGALARRAFLKEHQRRAEFFTCSSRM